jgi:hypothetical protein
MFTRLEDLSNELIIEIFDYTKISDLSVAFWNLNKRFNQLIRSLRYLSLNLTKNEDCLFAQQIVRLVIVTLDQIHLNSFINLRTLIINWGTEYHLKQIRSDILPNLIYLSLSVSFDFQSTKSLALEIFSNRFTSLRYADLGKISMPIVSSWSQSPSIRSILIVSININIIPLILCSCPQLTHFQVRICGENDLDLSSLPIIFNHPLKQFIFIQSQTSTFVFNLTNIFYFIPNLKRIDLRLCTRSFIDLIQFISDHFIYLNRFDCHIIEYPYKDANLDINLLRNIHRCYSSIQCTLREDSFCLYTTNKLLL